MYHADCVPSKPYRLRMRSERVLSGFTDGRKTSIRGERSVFRDLESVYRMSRSGLGEEILASQGCFVVESRPAPTSMQTAIKGDHEEEAKMRLLP